MADRVNIGRFREKVVFQSSTRTISANGAPVQTWTNAATVLAEVRDERASEETVNDNVDARRSVSVRCYRVTGLNHSWRMSWNGSYWDIISIQEEQDRPFVRLTCIRNIQ